MAWANLVQLYEKWGQPDQAKEWQEKLDAMKGQRNQRARRNELNRRMTEFSLDM